MKLDRSKPFSTINGVFLDMPGAIYEQNGIYFRSNESMIDGQEPVEQEPAEDVKEKIDPVAEVMGMYRDGMTSVEIGRVIGIHFNTVNAIIRRENK